jgi:protein TonB
VAASVLLHVTAIGLLTVMPRGRPAPAPPAQGQVELLMVEQKGAEASQGGPPPARPQPQVKPEAQQKAVTETPPPAPAPVVAKGGDELVPAPAPPAKEPAKDLPPAPQPVEKDETAEKAEAAPPVKPTPPAPKKALVFDLSGTDSESNAEVISGDVLPASPDDRFRNRPPPYPEDAARRGEHGSVTVMIHVGANGAASGVDVVESSGSASLDRAAVAAVRTWHFHPALKDSEPVPFDMPFRFDFRAD